MLKIGTAQIDCRGGRQVTVRYMLTTSFLVGERTFASILEAMDFCRDRGLRTVA